MKNSDTMTRRKTISNHITLLESRHSEPDRRIAVAALKGRIFELREHSRSRLNSLLVKCRSRIAFFLLKFVPDLVIAGYLPGRVGRYLVIDTLVVWSEEDANI